MIRLGAVGIPFVSVLWFLSPYSTVICLSKTLVAMMHMMMSQWMVMILVFGDYPDLSRSSIPELHQYEGELFPFCQICTEYIS